MPSIPEQTDRDQGAEPDGGGRDGYRRAVAHWVISAKKDETRRKRLETLIACSARGAPVPPLIPRKGKSAP